MNPVHDRSRVRAQLVMSGKLLSGFVAEHSVVGCENNRPQSVWRHLFPARCFSVCMISLAGILLVGCGDPIYDSVEFAPASDLVELSVQEDATRYEWPLSRDGYVVAKPPQMPFVTSFSGLLSRPDPVSAKVVPWSEEGLDDLAIKFLNDSYGPISSEPKVVFSVAKKEIAGPQAFDFSINGQWLAVVNDKGIDFYETSDGSLVDPILFPPEVVAAAPPIDTVRFCNTSTDMLIASAKKIFRIRREDGSVIAQCEGCGDSIAQWIVSDDDKAMVVRTESGRLFGGDANLKRFAAYTLGKNRVFDSVSLSPDGKRIGVSADGIPRTYFQENSLIVDQADHSKTKLIGRSAIASGPYSDAWTSESGLAYTTPGENGNRVTGGCYLLWKPLAISMCTDVPDSNRFLIVATRLVKGQEQVILFDFGANSKSASRPLVLDEIPIRLAHGRRGIAVGLYGAGGLKVIRRNPEWYNRPLGLILSTYRWVNSGKPEIAERVCEILKTQTRLGAGSTPEELRTAAIRAIAQRWHQIAVDEPGSDALVALKNWRNKESQIALAVDGLRHYWLAWEARGNGMANSVTEQGWTVYREHLEIAKVSLDQALELGDPPLIALNFRIFVGMELDGRLEGVDSFCRQAAELYPGELDPNYDIMIKLLPRWYGERGDTLSFALSASKMLEGRQGDLQYMRLVCFKGDIVGEDDTLGWKSFDYSRMKRGFDEYVRRGHRSDTILWNFWTILFHKVHDQTVSDRVLKHLMEHEASMPDFVVRDVDFGHTVVAVNQIREEARRKERVRRSK